MKNQNKKDKACLVCNKQYQVSSCFDKTSKYCSRECYHKSKKTGQKANCECSYCDNEFYKAPSLQRKSSNNFCSIPCMGSYYSENNLFSGKNSGTWQGGKINYYGRNWNYQKSLARERDNFLCQTCGISEKVYGKKLSVNHKIPFVCFSDYKKANELNNLECLCEPCHRKHHSGDNHPSKFKDTYKNYFDILNR